MAVADANQSGNKLKINVVIYGGLFEGIYLPI